MSADRIAAALLIVGAGWLLVWGIRKHLAEVSAKVDRLISDALDERPASEWIAGLYDHPPIFAEVEADLGPIFEAGYERQAQRLREELEDRAAFDRWLRGAS